MFINGQVTIIMYVGDLLLLRSDRNDIQELMKRFHKKFEMINLKPCKQFYRIQASGIG